MRFHPVSSVDEVLALALEDTRVEEVAAAALSMAASGVRAA